MTLNKQTCLPLDDNFGCRELEEVEEPICAICEKGYKLNASYECEPDATSSISNCLVARLDNTTCAIC